MAIAPLGKAIDVVGAPNGQFWIFSLNVDGQMIYKYWDDSAWQPSQGGWESLGGNFASPPSASLRSYTQTESRLDVIGVTSSGKLAHKYWDGTEWQPSQVGWDYLGALGNPPTVPFAHPVAITGLEGPHLVDIVAVGKDRQAYHKYWDGASWQPSGIWEALAGAIISPPALAGLDTLQLKFNVFGLDQSSNVLHKYWDGAAWQPSQTNWANLGGANFSIARLSARGMSSDVQFDVFGVGDGSGVFHNSFSVSAGWQNWESLGNGEFNWLSGFPAVVQCDYPLNRVDVFVANYTGLWHNYKGYFGGAWLPNWEALPGPPGPPAPFFFCAPAADSVFSPALGTAVLHVVCLNYLEMLHKSFDINGWHPSPPNAWDGLGYGLGNQGFKNLAPLYL